MAAIGHLLLVALKFKEQSVLTDVAASNGPVQTDLGAVKGITDTLLPAAERLIVSSPSGCRRELEDLSGFGNTPNLISLALKISVVLAGFYLYILAR